MTCLVWGDTLNADYTVTGTFSFEDRLQDRGGFTGDIQELPIRLADVEVIDDQTSAVLASGFTDSTGDFSIDVVDNTVRDVVIRVVTTSDYCQSLRLKVGSWFNREPYAMESPAYTNHNPNTDIDLGTVMGTWDAAGQPFNFFDAMFNILIFLNTFEGGDPGGYALMEGVWSDNANGSQAFYNGRVNIGDNLIYDDTVIQHEAGHWTNSRFSGDHNPGGTHFINLCTQDPRLAYGEGVASWYSNAARDYLGIGPAPHLHVVTTGQPGSGNLDFSYGAEGPSYYCQGPEHEITTNAVLWDMSDGPGTLDDSPGVDDDPMSADYEDIWDVLLNYMEYQPYFITLENFWDGWFVLDNGMYDEMVEVWGFWAMEYYTDDLEPDNNITQASQLTIQEKIQHHTLYAAGDEDWTELAIIENATFRVRGTNIIPETFPVLTVYESDGVTEVGSNIDDILSPVEFTPSGPGPYYVTSNQLEEYGVVFTEYGNFDLEFFVSEAPPESAQVDITPTVLVKVAEVGQVLTDTVTVYNVGGGPLHYAFSDRDRFSGDPGDLPWLIENPDSGVVSSGDSVLCEVVFNTAGLAPDSSYDALILISSNDLVHPELEIIVRLTTLSSTGSGDDEISPIALPRVFSLAQNSPNPFNPSTTIHYDVPVGYEAGVDVLLEIYNVRGQRVITLVDAVKEPGSYRIHWDGRDENGQSLGSGIYLYRIKAGRFTSTKKMVIVR
jgi:hypothetical protein